MIINLGLGSKPGNKPASLAKIATNLLHATQWAAMHGGSIRMFNPYAEDPTVVIEVPTTLHFGGWRYRLEVLQQRCAQQCVAVWMGGNGKHFVGEPSPAWNDKAFLTPSGRCLHDVHRDAQVCAQERDTMPRRDYGRSVDYPILSARAS